MKFMQYIMEWGKSYGTSEEYEFRLGVWMSKEAFIQEHNMTNASYKVAHNQFSDWTDAEYKRLLGYRPEIFVDGIVPTASFPNATVAASIDWRTKGAVTPVKDQGQCGSCWAFSSTGAMEGAHFVKSGELLSFSEQQLVDCDKLSFGCNGGNQSTAFNYYKSHFAELESVYSYTAKNGTCAYDSKSKTAVDVTAYTKVTPDSPDSLKAALNIAPVSVSIEADKMCFQLYSSGVFDNANCGTTLDHAVLAVGYGTENGADYWIVKNSWNTTWGEQGYIRMAIVDGAGICGIQMGPLYPTANE